MTVQAGADLMWEARGGRRGSGLADLMWEAIYVQDLGVFHILFWLAALLTEGPIEGLDNLRHQVSLRCTVQGPGLRRLPWNVLTALGVKIRTEGAIKGPSAALPVSATTNPAP